jgi:drug/metabolite transporter (DMT)-like permease
MVYVLLLLTAASIFGFSFVAMQRASAHLSAIAFNGITWLFLAETMSHQAVPGCGLMFSAIFIVQLKNADVPDDERAGPHKAPGRQPRHA